VPRPDAIAELATIDDLRNRSAIEPVHSRVRLGNDLTFENYVSSGVVEIPEVEHPTHVLILRTGSPSVIEWRTNGRDHRAELLPGSVSLLPAGTRQAARVFRPLPGMASILEFHPRLFNRSIAEFAKSGRAELIRHANLNDPQIARLIEALRADISAGSPSGSLFAESIGMALSAHLAQRYSTLTTPLETYRGGLSPSRLNRMLEYIHAHLDERVELSKLADVAGLNVYHFARAFKQSTGESPHQFVLRQRIEHAKQLLRRPQLSVIEASVRTGFVDQSHFSKVFRRMVGVAPSEYRGNSG